MCKLHQKLNDCVLEVGAMAVSAEANGPGHRLAIWLQWCPFVKVVSILNSDLWKEEKKSKLPLLWKQLSEIE